MFSIYTVTSLADDGSDGTLRYGIDNAASGPQTIVFSPTLAGGTIDLTLDEGTLTLDHSSGELTIQAPQDTVISFSGNLITGIGYRPDSGSPLAPAAIVIQSFLASSTPPQYLMNMFDANVITEASIGLAVYNLKTGVQLGDTVLSDSFSSSDGSGGSTEISVPYAASDTPVISFEDFWQGYFTP